MENELVLPLRYRPFCYSVWLLSRFYGSRINYNSWPIGTFRNVGTNQGLASISLRKKRHALVRVEYVGLHVVENLRLAA